MQDKTALRLKVLLESKTWEKNIQAIDVYRNFLNEKIKPQIHKKESEKTFFKKHPNVEKRYLQHKNDVRKNLENMLFLFFHQQINLESLKEMELTLNDYHGLSLGQQSKLLFKIIHNFYYLNKNFDKYNLLKSLSELGGMKTLTNNIIFSLENYINEYFDDILATKKAKDEKLLNIAS